VQAMTRMVFVLMYTMAISCVTNTEEFSLQLFNLDLSTVANMQQWKGQDGQVMKTAFH